MHRKNNNAYNPGKILKVLIVSDGIIVDIIRDKKVHKIVTELFMRGRKINISLIFILQLHQKIPKDVRQDTTHFFMMKILSRQELQQMFFLSTN